MKSKENWGFPGLPMFPWKPIDLCFLEPQVALVSSEGHQQYRQTLKVPVWLELVTMLDDTDGPW